MYNVHCTQMDKRFKPARTKMYVKTAKTKNIYLIINIINRRNSSHILLTVYRYNISNIIIKLQTIKK